MEGGQNNKKNVWKVIRNHTINYLPRNTCNVYKTVCKYTYIIKIIFPSWLTIFLLKVKDPLRKTLTPGMRSPLLSCWAWLSKRLPKHCRPLLLPLVASRVGREVPIASDTSPRSLWPRTDPKASSLGINFHGTTHASFHRKQPSLTQPWLWWATTSMAW